jgi:hypothetical protein
MSFRWAPWLVSAIFWAPGLRASPCEEPAETRIWWSPQDPIPGQSLRLLAVSGQPGEGAKLVLVRDQAPVTTLTTTLRGGPPWSFAAELADAPAGSTRIELRRGSRLIACRKLEIQIPAARGRVLPAPEGVYWKSQRTWDASTENLFSAWVEALFDAPPEETLTFRPLTPALRDPRRNFLHDHLGLREDDPSNRQAFPAEPDCADLPYVLRGYFAWKLALPMGMRDCSRGTATSPPRCGEVITNESPPEVTARPPAVAGSVTQVKKPAATPSALSVVRRFFRRLANTAHSGSARTALADEATDFYPVELTRAALRPGAVYADPYGHVLVLVKWVPESSGKGGLLLAVDGQPDGSIGRKRFWEGTFLFASEKSSGPGWKAFRPLVPGQKSSQIVAKGNENAGNEASAALAPLSNRALGQPSASRSGFARFSLEQGSLAPDEFYARMSRSINPSGLRPSVAYEEMLTALVEQLETRVGSVENGEVYLKQTRDAVVPMPEGPKIFETTGSWEDYATPSRDMRLIIAMKVIQSLPERIVKRPELFLLEKRKPEQARKDIEALAVRRTRERSIEYKRTDGVAQRLTVAELLARKSRFEMAYNPNDCIEIRWGAKEGDAELASCKRRAPPDQRARMEQYRNWFRDARRPPR